MWVTILNRVVRAGSMEKMMREFTWWVSGREVCTRQSKQAARRLWGGSIPDMFMEQ